MRGEEVEEIKLMPQHGKLNITNGPEPTALDLVQDSIEQLQGLRRRLCSYVNSDKFCDCKYLSPPDNRRIDPHKRGGEFSGCLEVREAIFGLQVVERSITGIDPSSIQTKRDAKKLFCWKCQSELFEDSPLVILRTLEPGGAPIGYRHRACGFDVYIRGQFGNCHDCGIPFGDPSACFAWELVVPHQPNAINPMKLGTKLVNVCVTCNEKRVRQLERPA